MFKSYQERKAQKSLKEAKKIQAEKEKKVRIPELISVDAENISGQIGRLHHQKVCIEGQLQGATNQFHRLVLELDESQKIHGTLEARRGEAPSV